MYPPPHHVSQDRKQMIEVMKSFPFGTLVTAENSRPYVTHIPIIYNEQSGNLVAHIDAMNPQVATLKNGKEATAIFKGPDCYISPSVYSTEQLPTWNYIIVHIAGIIHEITAPEDVKSTLMAMTSFLEGSEQRYILERDNPKMDRLVNYIRAFEIEITHWEGKFKLSQDKNAEDYQLARQALIQQSKKDYAEFIEKIYKLA